MAVIYEKTAVNCPAVQYATTFPSPAAAYTSGAIVTAVFQDFDPSEKPLLRPKLVSNVAQSILTTISGSSAVFAITFGLDITADADTATATVSAGQAQIGGAVELLEETDVALSVGLNRLWLLENGDIALQLNTIAPPSGMPAVYLGLVTVESDSTGPLDTDRSGVFVTRGSNRWRRTADATTPGDSPPDVVGFQHRSGSGPLPSDSHLFEWDGLSYTRVGDGTDGAPGLAATIAVGTVVPLASGLDPTITNSGNETTAIFDFGIPIGPKGDPGSGEPGSKIFSDAGVPDSLLGSDGDYYIDTATGSGKGDVYLKTAGTWDIILNIEGPPGADGIDGTDGVDGVDGTDGTDGADGADGAGITLDPNDADDGEVVGVVDDGMGGKEFGFVPSLLGYEDITIDATAQTALGVPYDVPAATNLKTCRILIVSTGYSGDVTLNFSGAGVYAYRNKHYIVVNRIQQSDYTDAAVRVTGLNADVSAAGTIRDSILPTYGSAMIVRLDDVTTGVVAVPFPVAHYPQTAVPEVHSATVTLGPRCFGRLVLLDTTSGDFTATLPSAAGWSGQRLRIKWVSGLLIDAPTLDGDGTETIDGASTYTFAAVGEFIALESDGTNWIIVS